MQDGYFLCNSMQSATSLKVNEADLLSHAGAFCVSGTHGRLDDLLKESAIIQKCCVFARTTPLQKKIIVENLRANWRVAFVGDGNNDLLSLQAADVGIALQEEKAAELHIKKE